MKCIMLLSHSKLTERQRPQWFNRIQIFFFLMRLKQDVKRHLWAEVSIAGNLPHFFLFFCYPECSHQQGCHVGTEQDNWSKIRWFSAS